MITQKKTSEQCFDKGIHLTVDLKHTRIFADALQLNDFKSSWQSDPHFKVIHKENSKFLNRVFPIPCL